MQRNKKQTKKNPWAVSVGFSLTLTACRGGKHRDKRLKRLNTRATRQRAEMDTH